MGAPGVGGASLRCQEMGTSLWVEPGGLDPSGQQRYKGASQGPGRAGLLGPGPRASQPGSRWLAGGSEPSLPAPPPPPAVPAMPLPTTCSWSPRLPWPSGAGSWCFCLWAQGRVSHRRLHPRKQPLPPNGQFPGHLWVCPRLRGCWEAPPPPPPRASVPSEVAPWNKVRAGAASLLGVAGPAPTLPQKRRKTSQALREGVEQDGRGTS